MQMSKLHIALLSLMLGGSIMMTACTPKDATSEHEAESSSLDSKDGSDLKDKTEAKAIKNFPHQMMRMILDCSPPIKPSSTV